MRSKRDKQGKSRFIKTTTGRFGIAFGPGRPPCAVIYATMLSYDDKLSDVPQIGPLCMTPLEWKWIIDSLHSELEILLEEGLRCFEAEGLELRRSK